MGLDEVLGGVVSWITGHRVETIVGILVNPYLKQRFGFALSFGWLIKSASIA